MLYLTSRSIIILLTVALSGCGGSSNEAEIESRPVDEPDTSMSYRNLNYQGNGTSNLEGNAIRQGNTSIISTSGTLRHANGRLAISDGRYELIDADGLDENGLLIDENSYLLVDDNFKNYKFSLAYQQSYTWRGSVYDSIGVIGISTQDTDMPVTGSSNFSGRSTGVLVTSASGYDLLNGKVDVYVNFANSEATIEISGFNMRDHNTGQILDGPIDSIRTTGVSIDGNNLGGGDISTYLDASVVQLFGSDSTSDIRGNFYGIDEKKGLPAEVGGLLAIEGNDGFLIGGFIAN